jgi:hypothetical protein
MEANRSEPTRNSTLEFARRTRSNLQVIEEVVERDPDADAHVVTQLALSLLGIVRRVLFEITRISTRHGVQT